jgi:hypothetical protein
MQSFLRTVSIGSDDQVSRITQPPNHTTKSAMVEQLAQFGGETVG